MANIKKAKPLNKERFETALQRKGFSKYAFAKKVFPSIADPTRKLYKYLEAEEIAPDVLKVFAKELEVLPDYLSGISTLREDKRKSIKNIDFDPEQLDRLLKDRNIVSIKQRTEFLEACGCSYSNYKAWKRRKSISESDLTAILYRLGVTADQLCVANYKEAMNVYKDWIVRFYASHKDIPKGHSDCETLKELVRCKDCKYGQKRTKPYMYCDIFGAVTETEWFCSKAERKEE